MPILRAKLTAALRTTNSLVASPTDKFAQLMLEQPAEAAIARVAAELGIFLAIHQEGTPQSVQGLARITGAKLALLARLLRTSSAIGAVKEVGEDGYEVAFTYGLFEEKSFEDCYGPCIDFMNKIFLPIPEFLRANNYKNLANPMNTVIQQSQMMSLWSGGWTQFQTLYPVQEKLIQNHNMSEEEVMFVDVGGNWGQQALSLKKAFPELSGRVIVQDLYAIDAAPKDDPQYAGIEWMKVDYFGEQPIIGARVYYLRTILHNWNDEQCVLILKRLRAAMVEGRSRVIIHECLMPERGPGQWITTQDTEMMAMFGSAERTVAHYHQICEQAGLHLVRKYQDNNPSHEGLLEVEL